MAQSEGSVDEAKPTPEELRKTLLDRTLFSSVRLRAKVEQAANEIYSAPIGALFDGKEHGVLQFKRWTHQQANRFQNLPFLSKFNDKGAKLTDGERVHYLNFKREMVLDALLEAPRWKELTEDEAFVNAIFTLIAKVSGVSAEFDDELERFMQTDYGFFYGQVWFSMLGKVPSDIGKLPETDVRVVNAWIKNWSERVSKNNVR